MLIPWDHLQVWNGKAEWSFGAAFQNLNHQLKQNINGYDKPMPYQTQF